MNRRRFLRSSSLALSLPLLESRRPADALGAAAGSSAGAASVNRLVTVGVYLGFHTPSWFPRQTGREYTMSPVLKPLDDLRERFSIFSGLDHRALNGHRHWKNYLTGKTTPGISLDQRVANEIGDRSRFASLQVTCGSGGDSQMSFTKEGIALPPIGRPSVLFGKLFSSDSDKARMEYILDSNGSALDLVLDEARTLKRQVSARDAEKLDEYFSALRDVEKKLQKQQKWLDLRLLPDIMPDPRLLKWIEKDLAAVTAETELFVAEILRKNHPLETFIDPDFTYLNKRNAKLYGIKHPNSDKMVRAALEPGGRRGGILTQASVMMATANGVDTQPVLRGVWLLENVFGSSVPEPPTNVPAVEPDTTGATSIRDLLDRHTADPSCAGCHQKIDPPGFALENFDPVGRWRDHYPVYEGKGDEVVRKDGLPVDATGTLEDGTEFTDVTDLKRYLVENIDVFANCLAGKLLEYATGRDLGFGDRKEVERIVEAVRVKGNGFQDLIVALVLSEAFGTK